MKINQTDKQSWDDFITQSGIETSFFQSWNWGEFQKSLGNDVARIVLEDDLGKIVAAAQGIVINAKRGKYLYVRNGPVLDWTKTALVEQMQQAMLAAAKERGMWFVRISPLLEKDSPGADYIKQQKWPISPMYDVDALDTWILGLEQTEEEILQGMRKSTRYEIRKAEREGVEVIKTTDSALISDFYKIYQDTVERQKWTGYSEEYIRKQFETFVKDNQALLYLAKHEGKYVAASIFIYYGDTSFYHYSGSLSDAARIPAPSAIHWENIKEAKNRGLKQYNFWGIAPEGKPNHPWQGLSFYKMGFGGSARRWLPTRDIPISTLYWLTNFYEKIQKRFKGY